MHCPDLMSSFYSSFPSLSFVLVSMGSRSRPSPRSTGRAGAPWWGCYGERSPVMIQRASPGLPAGDKFTPQIKSAEGYSPRERTERELESCVLWRVGKVGSGLWRRVNSQVWLTWKANTSGIPWKIEPCPRADIDHWNRLMFFNKEMDGDGVSCQKDVSAGNGGYWQIFCFHCKPQD